MRPVRPFLPVSWLSEHRCFVREGSVILSLETHFYHNFRLQSIPGEVERGLIEGAQKKKKEEERGKTNDFVHQWEEWRELVRY